MEKDYKNKKLEPDRTKEPDELQEFHYPGGGKYCPITIKAKSREEADEKWKEQRVEIETN